MIKLYVIRHGETDFNKEGRYLGRSSVSLNSTGIVQARKLAQGVEELGIEVIYVSPSNRTLETANIINENKDYKIINNPAFVERAMGVYEGKTKEEAKKEFPNLYKQNITRVFDKAPLKGETIKEVEERVFKGLDEIKKQKEYSKVMIVTHAFIAKVINKYFNPNISEEDFFNSFLGNAEIVKYNLNN